MGGDVSQPDARSNTKKPAPPAIMTSNTQLTAVHFAAPVSNGGPPSHKIKLLAGQPPRSKEERAPKRAHETGEDDNINRQDSKRPKINGEPPAEAPSRRRSKSSSRVSNAHLVTPVSWKEGYDTAFPQLEKERDETCVASSTNHMKTLHPLCTRRGINIANWTLGAKDVVPRLAGYLNLYNAAQVSVLWKICQTELNALFASHEEGYKTTGHEYETVDLDAFIKVLEEGPIGLIRVEDITSVEEPPLALVHGSSMSENWRSLVLARFIHQVFCAVALQRENDRDFPNVFSGAGEGQAGKVVYKDTLNWVTEDIGRAVAMWSLWVVRRKSKRDGDAVKTRGTSKLPVLPIFADGKEHSDTDRTVLTRNNATEFDESIIFRPATRSTTTAVENVERSVPSKHQAVGASVARAALDELSRKTPASSPPAALLPINKPDTNMANGPASSNLIDRSTTTAKPVDRLASFAELNNTVNSQPNAPMEKTDRAQAQAPPEALRGERTPSGIVPTPPATVRNAGPPAIAVPELGTSPSPTTKPSSSTTQNRPSTAGLFRQIMESNLVTSQSMDDEAPVDKLPSIYSLSIGEQRRAEAKRKYEEIKNLKADALRVEAEKDRIYQQERKLKDEVDEKVVAALEAKSAQELEEVIKIKEKYTVKDELIKKVRSQRESDVEALRSGNV
ncbi:hypothetical protein LTR56_024072 [Elasticomyces elasticus]|nr:hypothetical protein LTR56_024072 [Elasticomyces elasticus]KAK3666633.1 hypothetical protein LTR22_002581 [Elasticomyces elasticus]